MKKIAVVGAGAAGLMAAAEAAKSGADVTVFEKNERLARKLMITGKGRCNVTNIADNQTFLNNVVTNSKFMYSAISEFSCKDTFEYFENLGVELKVERGGRVFPNTDKAVTVVDALVKNAKQHNVKIIKKQVTDISKDLVINKTEKFDGIIICTGGKSYSLTGSTGDGYKFARQLGHTVTDIYPALVPLESDDSFCSELSGLSLKNVVFSVYEKSTVTNNVNAENNGNKKSDKKQKTKPVFSELGEMLFCHFGISGPLVLSASCNLNFNKKEYYGEIDLKPGLNEEQLEKRILRDFENNINKEIHNIIGLLVPYKLGLFVLKQADINKNQKINEFTKEMRKRLTFALKHFKINLKGFRPIEEAIITKGGVNVKEINPKTFESKLVKGIYFAGEVLDVNAYTGGYNLQIAFSSGYIAGRSSAEE